MKHVRRNQERSLKSNKETGRMLVEGQPRSGGISRRFVIVIAGLALLCAGLLPSAASAAPSLQVSMTRDVDVLPVVHRGDQRVDYDITVSNAASSDPAVGDVLTCDPKASSWFQGPTFTLKWIRDGNLASPLAESPGGTMAAPLTGTYTVQAGDAGHILQCAVAGANGGGTGLSISRPVKVLPVPSAPPPPDYPALLTANPRPTVANGGTAQTGLRTCTEPTTWTGGPSFSFQWLRNGSPIGGATAATYAPAVIATGTGTLTSGSEAVTGVTTSTGAFVAGARIVGNGIPQGTTIASVGAGTLTLSAPATASGAKALTAGDDAGVNLQCAVIGKTGAAAPPSGGAATGISNNSLTCSTGATGECTITPPNNNGANSNILPFILGSNATTGTVVVELPLPPGAVVERFYVPTVIQQTPTLTPNGWTCQAQAASPGNPAKAICERSNSLSPEAAYLPFSVAIELGATVPDVLAFSATVSGGGSASDTATDEVTLAPAKVFGIEAFETFVSDQLGEPFSTAGGHPYSSATEFSFRKYREAHPEVANGSNFRLVGRAKTVRIETPRGFIGNVTAIKQICPSTTEVLENKCPEASAVGGIVLTLEDGGLFGKTKEVPIYAIEPEFGRPAQFAFFDTLVKGVYTFYPKLRAADGYAITLESTPFASAFPSVTDISAELCGFGARTKTETFQALFDGCKTANDPTSTAKPLVTLPTRCTATPPTTTLSVDSWEQQGKFVSASWTDPPLEECDAVEFEPDMKLQPLSSQADSPTGMDVEIAMPTDGLESKTGISQAHLKQVTVTLPPGMALNATAAHGLGACSAAQVGINPATGVPNEAEAACPDSSKIGTAEVVTPLLADKLGGNAYLAAQGADNPFGTNLALYFVISSPKHGITIKLAGSVKPDPISGQLQVRFAENPEAPFSSVSLSFPQGPRAALLNPPKCGTYEIKAELSPWNAADPDNPAAGEIVETTSPFTVDQGPGGGPCPSEALEPKLAAGTTNPVAGQSSPFVLRLHREDGTQRFAGLEVAPPLGLTAYLRGVPYCSDAALASISAAAETGRAQIAEPSCPAASLIGHAQAGAGAGANPFYVDTGKVYLAGPYKGAPISLAVVTPAVAGPLDLGNVVIRTALHVDPVSAQIKAISDPIPTILHGILLDVRDIRVQIDRPGFMLNPTSCEEKSLSATVKGAKGPSANQPGDSVSVSNRFQVGECAALGFKPRTQIQLFGGVTRAKYQGVRAVVRPRAGDANIAGATVRFPSSAFVAQEHLQNICTRVQWAADACPKNSVYGRAIAYSPLLDEPLRGNLHLRSSNNLLPDLVADLRGPAHQPIRVEVAVRNDSVKGALRNTVQTAPDAPVSFFRMQVFGGKKALIVNSRNICQGKNSAQVSYRAHNGRRSSQAIPVRNAKCGKWRKAQKRKAAQKRKRMMAQRRAAARQG